ncbi:MAG: hypothetical protein MUP71_01190 [Candidatus Aminicenantes bacterium]|nr:hypothetical protein [Candidatus Aminicenantes bacterium]
MIKVNEKIVATLSAIISGIFIIAIYILNRSVPLTDIYLGRDRISHVKVVFISGFIGIFILFILKKIKSVKIVRFLGYGLSLIFMAGIPILLFSTEYQSFRGTKWAIETLIIGLIPVLFIYAAFLVYFNNRIMNLFLAFIFAAFSSYHLLLLIRVLPRMGKAFSTTGKSDLWIMIAIILSTTFFSFYSLKRYLNFKK